MRRNEHEHETDWPGAVTLAGSRRASPLGAALVVAVVTAAVYGSALFGEFVFDDRPFLVDNPKLARLVGTAGAFQRGVWAFSNVTDTDTALYRPLFVVVLGVNRALWSDNPLGYHVFSLALHVANSLLVMLLLTRLLPAGGWLAPFGGALVFALHPVHIEAVAWISAVVHLLVTFLLLVSFLMYLEHQATGTTAPLVGALVSFGLALLTQEIAVTYPMILAAHELLRRAPRPYRRVVPFVTLVAVYFAVRRLLLGASVPLTFTSADGWSKTAMLGAGYVKQLLVPWPQPLFLRTPDDFPSAWSIVLAAAAVVMLATLLARRPGGSALLWLATAWCAISLLPGIAAAFHERHLFAVRSLYLPSVAIAIYAAWGVAYPLRERPASILAALAVLAGVSGGIVIVGNRDWQNDGLVYARIVRDSPHEPGAHMGLGRYFERTGREDMAVAAFGAAARDGSGVERADAYESLGVLFGKRGDVERSEAYFRKVLEFAPNRSPAWVGLGNNAWQRRSYVEALAFYRKAYAADPANYEACHNLALAYEAVGDAASARYYASVAMRLRSRAASRPAAD